MKTAVKLDLGEMCKLSFYFLSAVNTGLHIHLFVFIVALNLSRQA